MKRFIMLFILAVGFAFTLQITANAETADVNTTQTSHYDQATIIANTANAIIEQQVNMAIQQAAALDPNSATYEQQLDVIINNVVRNTNLISKITISIGQSLGVKLVCVNQVYVIGDRAVTIDPIRVVDW